jgi:hypothetical protein
MKTSFIQVLTKCFIPSCSISLGPAYAHKLKTLWNIATLANITRHKERSMDTYLSWTNNKLLTHGTQLQLTPLYHGSFRSHHIHSSKSKEPTTLQALTIIDLNMHFMGIVALQNKESITATHSLDQVWLCCYPHLVDCLHDNGIEFISAKFQEIFQSYGIWSKLTTVKNPQANGILECIHQVIGNLLHSSRIIAQSLLKTLTLYLPNKNFSCQLCGPSTQHSIQP